MKGTIVKVIEINAPPERVYKAFTNKQDMVEWMADDFEIDPKIGGKFKMGRESDGHVIGGEILEVAPGKRLVYTWGMNDYDTKTGKKIPHWSDDSPTKVTVLFEKAGKGTKVTVKHEGFPERDEEYWGHAVGWDFLGGEVLKYYLEHSKAEFDKWWKENESAWQERWQKAVEARVKAAEN
jgi:uncharacterized protein YndB with AHSA1/START domain